MEEAPKKIILLSEVIEQKLRKEKELEFYQKELEKLQEKMYWLRREVDLTNTIIRVIENEQVIDIRDEMSKKLIERSDK
jgi:hypothetical protein